MANYWDPGGGGSGYNPNAPKKIPQDDLSRLVAQVVAQNQGGIPWGNTGANAFDPVKLVSQQNYNIPGTAIPKPQYVQQSMPQQNVDVNALKSMFGNVLNAGSDAYAVGVAKNTGQSILDAVGQMFGGTESVEDLTRRLMQQYMPQYTGQDPAAMAKSEFAPQFQMLAEIAKQQKGRYDQNAPKIVDLYRALNDSAVQGRTADSAMYDKAIAGSKQIGQESSQALQDRYNQALQSQADQYKMLGIEDAAPTTFGKQAQTLNDNQAAQTQQNAVFQQLNNSLKGNQYGYDTANIGIQKQAGNQAQQNFLQQYLDQAAQTDMQRLQLQGQQQQAQNAYAQQIAQAMQGSLKDTGSFVNSMVGNILGDRKATAQNEVDQANAMTAQDRLNFDMSKPQGQQAQLNPYDALQKNAVGVLGNPQAARQFSDILLEAYLRNPGAQNIAQLMDSVGQDVLKQNPAYTSLAFDFFSKMLASQKR